MSIRAESKRALRLQRIEGETGAQAARSRFLNCDEVSGSIAAKNQNGIPFGAVGHNVQHTIC